MKIINLLKCCINIHEFKIRKLKGENIEVRTCTHCGLREYRRFVQPAKIRIPILPWSMDYDKTRRG